MIFPNLELEAIVQVNDRTRLNASKSYLTPGHPAIKKVEIKPSEDEDFFDVTSKDSEEVPQPDKWFLDWQYAEDGEMTVTVKVTDEDDDEFTFEKKIVSIAEEDDKLYSNDGDLRVEEPDIMDHLKQGRNTFLDMHRRAQEMIVKYFNAQGYIKDDKTPLTKSDFLNKDQVKEWSTYQALILIFSGLVLEPEDKYDVKKDYYTEKMLASRSMVSIKLDLDGDEEEDVGENLAVQSGDLIRR